jgi:hypothetical protein
MKYAITILLLFICSFTFSQVDKEIDFQKTVQDVIQAYNVKNATAFNKFINKKEGVYFLVKNGVYEFWHKRKQVQFKTSNDSTYLPYPYSSILCEQKLPANYSLTYSAYPNFNCNSSKNKVGLFIDTSYKVNSFSNLIKKYLKYNDIGLEKAVLKEELYKVKMIESTSRKILIISNRKTKWGESFIFYLTYINQKWYITVIDFASVDCSV